MGHTPRPSSCIAGRGTLEPNRQVGGDLDELKPRRGATISIFAVPKPFVGHIGVIQRNAVRSWKRLTGCQVILLGDEPGVEEIARELSADFVPTIATNEFGTPLLDSVFGAAERNAKHNILCYTNADILLPRNFGDVVSRVYERHDRFLMVGRTWDIEITHETDRDPDVADLLAHPGTDRGAGAIDYFAFPRGTIGPLPPFAVGRPGWDNWMIYRARSRMLPVVDASLVVHAVHQRHDHSHVPLRTHGPWNGPEGDRNHRLAAGTRFGVSVPTRLLTLLDATELVTADGFRASDVPARRHGLVGGKVEVFKTTLPGYLMQQAHRKIALGKRLRRLKLVAERRYRSRR